MTEQEALCTIIEHRPMIGFKRYAEALSVAMHALEEIQEYRAIGSVEELKEAKEKQTAKQPIIKETDEKKLYKCPCCDKVFVEAYDTVQRGFMPSYCNMCGQAIENMSVR